jgi:DNA-binding NarL/FixJ family response regulator
MKNIFDQAAPERPPALPATARRIRLLVVESHPIIRFGLAKLAESEPDIVSVGETGSGAQALELLATARPDVVSLGTTLDDSSGLRLARDLRDRHSNLGIVLLTSRSEDSVMFQALDTGVSALVSKVDSVAEIMAAIRHAAASPHRFSASGLSAALTRRANAPQRVVLSRRENEVLLLLHAGNSVPQIATALFVSLSTAKTYVARIYDKLGAKTRSQALMSAVRHGLIDLARVPAA